MASNLLDDAQLLQQGLASLSLSADELQQQQVLAYIRLLLQWNKAYNLTAAKDAQEIMVRHVLDSLTLLPFITKKKVLDVGSGAGFPGVMLAIFLKDNDIIVLDSNSKKTRFLNQVKIELSLDNLTVVNQRIEDYQQDNIATIVSRAYSSLLDFVKSTAHLCKQGDTQLLAMKGKYPTEELQQLSGDIKVAVRPTVVPLQQTERHIVVISYK